MQIIIPTPVIKMCSFKHTGLSGVGGGSTTANTFMKRPLSAVYFETSEPSSTVFSLDDANDEIDILEAGMYYIYCETFAFSGGRFYSALRAMNGPTTRVLGSSNAGSTTSNVSSTITGFFKVTPTAIGTSGASFAIYTKTVNSRATDGLGTPFSLDSEIETYATGYIQKIRNLIPSEE